TLGALGGRLGRWSSRTSRVMAMAKMPSLSASIRFFPSAKAVLSTCIVILFRLPGAAGALHRLARPPCANVCCRNHAFPVRLTGLPVEWGSTEVDTKAPAPDSYRPVFAQVHIRRHLVVLIANVALECPEVDEASCGHSLVVSGVIGGYEI